MVGITAYTQPVTIYQFQPHAHLRGRDFTYTVIYPDGVATWDKGNLPFGFSASGQGQLERAGVD